MIDRIVEVVALLLMLLLTHLAVWLVAWFVWQEWDIRQWTSDGRLAYSLLSISLASGWFIGAARRGQ